MEVVEVSRLAAVGMCVNYSGRIGNDSRARRILVTF